MPDPDMEGGDVLRLPVVALCLLCCVVPAWAEEPVFFPDAILKAAVEDALWTLDPTPTDMLELTALDGSNPGDSWPSITDLTGLEYALNLQTLELRHHKISDLSPLSGLSDLETVDLWSNRISSLDPLSGLSHLQWLNVEMNRISSLWPVASLTTLEFLNVHRNLIVDISPLTSLTSLTYLDLRVNPLNSEAYSLYLPQIEANNPGIRVEVDEPLSRKLIVTSGIGGSVIDPGEGEFWYQRGTMVRLEAKADPYFVFGEWSGNLIGTPTFPVNPLSIHVDEDYQMRANFRSTLNTIHVDDDAPADPGPGDPAISDPQENGTAEHPLDGVQEAIDVAADGVTIYVHAGSYPGTVNLHGKALTFIGFVPDEGGGGEQPVQFPDGSLKAAVEAALGLSDPTPTDMLGLTVLVAAGGGIADLSGLEHAIYLQTLRLRNNQVSDLSPLAGLRYLSLVDLQGNALDAQACSTYLPQILANNPGMTLLHDACATSRRLHVDDDAPADPGPGNSKVSDPQENGTAEHPFDRIQEAIDAAGDGAVILVHAGTYRESIDLLGKRITLTGFDPDDPSKAAWPVIDGGGTAPVVSFTRGEDPNCLLRGFVITGAKGAGAIRCSGGSPTIANCLIVGNRVMDASGAAVYCTDSNAVLTNCTIADNYAAVNGAALRLENSSVQVVNSIVRGILPGAILATGAGIPSIRYSNITGGWPGQGDIDDDPLFARVGSWVSGVDSSLVVSPDHPYAVWIMGDYHPQSQAGRWDGNLGRWVQDGVTSPCIDAGDPTSPALNEPLPNGSTINMGAYGGTAEASKSSRVTVLQ
jgi:hypothetical protein